MNCNARYRNARYNAMSWVPGSDPGLVDDPEDQGDEVDDEAVEDGNQADFDAAGNDVGCNVIVAGEEVHHLEPAEDGPEDADDEGGDADFLDPGGGFPGREEQRDEKKGDDDHSDRTAGDEEGE